ncbi:hypothetical protein ACWPKO_03485 [Coraliomargarita sp. W4R53]
MKKELPVKGILLGILLLGMAILSTVAVYQLRGQQQQQQQQQEAKQTETP